MLRQDAQSAESRFAWIVQLTKTITNVPSPPARNIDKLKQAIPAVAVYSSCQSRRTCGLLPCIHRHHHRPLTHAEEPRASVSLFRTAPKDR